MESGEVVSKAVRKLVAGGLLTEVELQAARERCAVLDEGLDRLLIRERLIPEEDMLKALSSVAGMPFVRLAELGIVGTGLLLILVFTLFKNWRLALVYKGGRTSTKDEAELSFYGSMTHACGISQIAFWMGSLFLSLMIYPFYWAIVPFSEAWKNLFVLHIQSEPSGSH